MVLIFTDVVAGYESGKSNVAGLLSSGPAEQE
jgi:hypothetical protein